MHVIKDEIVIRKFTENDIENKVRWINNPENNSFLHYDIPLTISKTKEWFLNKNNLNRLDCTIEYNQIPVGVIGLLNIDNKNSKAEFYITIGETCFKRKGIAQKATEAMLQYAFDILRLNKVYLNVDEENVAACKLYEKCGFILQKVYRCVRIALTTNTNWLLRLYKR